MRFRKALTRVDAAIVDFVTEKVAEGFTLPEIDALYAVDLPILLGYRADGGRIRVMYDSQIVER